MGKVRVGVRKDEKGVFIISDVFERNITYSLYARIDIVRLWQLPLFIW